MKYGRTLLPSLGIAIILSLLMVLIPAKPVLAAPTITLSPASGAIGTRVIITGTNFDSYIGDSLSIFFNGVEVASSLGTILETGDFSATFDIPTNAAAGTARVTVRGPLGSILAESSFFIPEAEIRLDIEEGTVGTVVTATGQGFSADKMVTFYFSFDGLREKLGTTLAGLAGEYSGQFTIPVSTAGMQRIVAEGAQGNSAEAQFNVLSSATVNPNSAAVGESVTVGGTGFYKNSRITISLGTTTVTFAETDEYGSFASIFAVPVMKARIYIIKIQDNRGNVDWTEFTITAGAKLNIATGNTGTELIVSGTGFTSGATITIKYDALEVATATANADGVFATAFNVPVSVSGGHLITVSDGTSIRHLAFTIESEAPPAPALLLPETGIEAESAIYFHWQEVDDPSLPITYNLQIAYDDGFTFVVLEKQGLSDPEYTLTEDEELKPTKKEVPYYWRVKAIDGASNESEWSSLRSFYPGAPPAPALLLPETGIEAESAIYFHWQEVDDPSLPITYNLQIASDEDFTFVVLEKQGLSDPEYTLTEEEKLEPARKDVTYYWRVKAIDGASNESEWSSPESFYISAGFTLPTWVIVVLIAVGVLVVGFLSYRVWYRRRYYY